MQVKKNQFSDYLISQFVTDKSASRPNARSSIAQIHVAIGQSALLRRTCLLLAQSGHRLVHRTCPLSGASRHDRLRMSAFAVAIGGKADMGWCTAYVCF